MWSFRNFQKFFFFKSYSLIIAKSENGKYWIEFESRILELRIRIKDRTCGSDIKNKPWSSDRSPRSGATIEYLYKREHPSYDVANPSYGVHMQGSWWGDNA